MVICGGRKYFYKEEEKNVRLFSLLVFLIDTYNDSSEISNARSFHQRFETIHDVCVSKHSTNLRGKWCLFAAVLCRYLVSSYSPMSNF